MKKLFYILILFPLLGTSQIIEPTGDVRPFHQLIGEDALGGYDSEFKFGENTAVGTTEEVIWDGGGTYTFLTSADSLKIISDDADDTLSGSGAHTLIVYGLDSNWNEINELVVMDGIDTVHTTKKFLRVFRALIPTSGNSSPIGNANEGVIKVLSATDLTLQAQIGVGNGQTLMCVYTVPADKTAYITGISFGVGQGKECTFKGKFRNGVNGAFSVKYSLTLYQESFYGSLQVPLRIPEKIDMVITGITATGTVRADASFGIILKDN